MNRPRGRPFQPGNKHGRGRPKGSRNQATRAAQRLLEEHSEPLVRRCIIEAMKGNMPALRLCMERVLPAPRQAPVPIKLPCVASATDVDSAQQAVVEAIASGGMTPSDGEIIMNILEVRRKAVETVELSQRVEQLESAARNFQGKAGESL